MFDPCSAPFTILPFIPILTGVNVSDSLIIIVDGNKDGHGISFKELFRLLEDGEGYRRLDEQ